MPDEFFDVLAPRLTEAELRVVLYIIRRTFGWKKNSDNISLRQMVEGIRTKDGRILDHGTGLSKPAVINAVRSLVQRKVIVATAHQSSEKGFEPTTYSLNVLQPSTPETPLSTTFTRGSQPALQALVNQDYPQQTVEQETDQQHVVVVKALQNFGVSAPVAYRLAKNYPPDLILRKLEFVEWLIDTHSSQVNKNPAGYLRRAIEDDYVPPPGYKTKAQRNADEERHKRAVQAAQQERLQAEEEVARIREEAQRKLDGLYPPSKIPGTDLTTETAWDLVKGQLQDQMSKANFETWVKETSLLSVESDVALIAAGSRFQVETLEGRLNPMIRKALSSLIQRPVLCRYEAISGLVRRHGRND